MIQSSRPLVVYKENPLDGRSTRASVEEGLSVRDALVRVGADPSMGSLRVLVDSEPVHPLRWDETHLVNGQGMTVINIPQDPVSITFAIIAALQVAAGVAATVGLQVLTTVASLGGAGIGSTLFKLAIFAIPFLIKPPKQDFGGGGASASSPSLQGVGNVVRPFEPIPQLFGTIKCFPPLGSFPFTEIVGGNQFVRVLLIVGKGEIAFTAADVFIGETQALSFPDSQVVVRNGLPGDGPLTLFSDQVIQEGVNIVFPSASSIEPAIGLFVTRSTADEIEEIELDFAFAGLKRINENGKPRTFSVSIDIEFSIKDADSWSKLANQPGFGPLGGDGNATVTAGRVLLVGSTTQPFFKSFGARVPKNEYDVRVRRIETEGATARAGGGNETAIFSDFTWTALKGFRFDAPPITEPEVATIEMRIRLSDQLGGTISDVNVIAQSKIPVYDPLGATGEPRDSDDWTTTNVLTNNTAALYRDVLQGNSNSVPLTNDEIDIEELSDWHDRCETDGFEFNFYQDFEVTFQEMLVTIASSSLAEPDEFESKLSVVQDKVRPIVSQVLTARTASGSSGFEVLYQIPELPHAVIVKHIDPEQGYEPNVETFAYRDGFSADGAGGTTAATKFQELQLVGAVNRERAWQFGRLLLNQANLRRRTFVYPCDLEHLALRRGNRVHLRHDTALFGLGEGRLTAVDTQSRFNEFVQDMFTDPVDAGDVVGVVTGPVEFDTSFSPRIAGIGVITALAGNSPFASFIFNDNIEADHTGEILRISVYLPTGLNTESGRVVSILVSDASGTSFKDFDVSEFPRDQWNTIEMDLEEDYLSLFGSPSTPDTLTLESVGIRWCIESPQNAVDRIYLGQMEFRENKIRPLHAPESKMETTTGLVSENSALAVDSSDKDRGNASIEITASSAAACAMSFSLATRFPLGINLIGRTIKFRVKPEVGFPTDVNDMLRFEIRTNSDHTSTFFFGTGDGVVVDSWETLSINIDTAVPDLTGPVNPADLTQIFTAKILFNQNSPANGRVLNTDHWEVEDNLTVVEVEGDGPPIYQAEQPYGVRIRTIDTGAATLESQRGDILNSVQQNEPDLRDKHMTFQHPFTPSLIPLVGDSYAFGLRQLETQDVVVSSIEMGPDLSATINMLDYAEGVFNLEDPPEFDAGTSLPLPSILLGPATPRINQIVSDERALVETKSGELKPRIWVSILPALEPSPGGLQRPASARYLPQIRITPGFVFPDDELIGVSLGLGQIGGDYKNIPAVDASSDMVSFDQVDEATSYDIRIRSVSAEGQLSDFATVLGHVVVGKSTLPPNVQGLRVEGGFLNWDQPFDVKDLAGFQVRYSQGSQNNFDNALQLHGAMPVFPPFSLGSVRKGLGTLLVKAIDQAGNVSEVAALVRADISGKDIENVVRILDLHGDGFETLQISAEIVDQFDNMDQTTGWTTSNGTLTVETDQRYEGTGALSNESGTSSLSQLRKLGLSPGVDWEDRILKIRVFLEPGVSEHPTSMLRIVIQGTVGSSATLFGTDDGVVVNGWNELSVDLAQVKIDIPSFTTDDIDNLSLHHNVTGGVAEAVAVWDDIRTEGGGTLESLGIETSPATGDLITQEIGQFYSDDPGSLFYNPNPLANFYDANFQAGTYRFQFTPDPADIPGRLTLELNDNTGVPVTITYRSANPFFYNQDGTSLFYGNAVDLFYDQRTDITVEPFQAWPGRLDVLQLTTYQFEVSMEGGPLQGRISQFDIVVDVPDQVQVVEDFTVSDSGDPRVTLTKVFRSIDEVLLTSQQTGGGDTPRAVLIDKQNTQGAGGGPHIRTFDDAGDRQVGKVDVRIIGVPA